MPDEGLCAKGDGRVDGAVEQSAALGDAAGVRGEQGMELAPGMHGVHATARGVAGRAETVDKGGVVLTGGLEHDLQVAKPQPRRCRWDLLRRQVWVEGAGRDPEAARLMSGTQGRRRTVRLHVRRLPHVAHVSRPHALPSPAWATIVCLRRAMVPSGIRDATSRSPMCAPRERRWSRVLVARGGCGAGPRPNDQLPSVPPSVMVARPHPSGAT